MLWIFVNYTKQSCFSKSWIISAFESILENAHFCTQQYSLGTINNYIIAVVQKMSHCDNKYILPAFSEIPRFLTMPTLIYSTKPYL